MVQSGTEWYRVVQSGTQWYTVVQSSKERNKGRKEYLKKSSRISGFKCTCFNVFCNVTFVSWIVKIFKSLCETYIWNCQV